MNTKKPKKVVKVYGIYYNFDSKSETYGHYVGRCPWCGNYLGGKEPGSAALYFFNHNIIDGCSRQGMPKYARD
jgi:hypothetical protein